VVKEKILETEQERARELSKFNGTKMSKPKTLNDHLQKVITGLEATDPHLADIFKKVANGEHPYGIHRIKGLTFYGAHGEIINPPRKSPKRNGKCPCGSGKKFKKCCIKEYHIVSKPIKGESDVKID
jgi:hypothetical protein